MSLPSGVRRYDAVVAALRSRHGADAQTALDTYAKTGLDLDNYFGCENGRVLSVRDMWWKGPFAAGDVSLVLKVNPGRIPPELLSRDGIDTAFHGPSLLFQDCTSLAQDWAKDHASLGGGSVTIRSYGLADTWCQLIVVGPASLASLNTGAIIHALCQAQPFSTPIRMFRTPQRHPAAQYNHPVKVAKL